MHPLPPKSSPPAASTHGSWDRRTFLGGLGGAMLPCALAAQTPSPEVHLLAMGDWGASPVMDDPDDVPRLHAAQNRVAAAMNEYAQKLEATGTPLTAVLPLGDNFYGPLKDATDKRFTERFEDLYPRSTLDVPFYFALGNHDYEDHQDKNWQHEIAYARQTQGTRWQFPAAGADTWYRVDLPPAQPLLSLIVLDTNTDHVKGRWTDQITWMEQALAQSQSSRWRMVMAHHPMFTDGYHFDGKKDPDLYPKIRETILPKLGSVTFYLSAHDHNQQHIQHPDHKHLDFLLSGAGGGEYVQKQRRFDSPWTNTFMENFGFVHLRFTKDQASAQFVGVSSQGWKALGDPIVRT